MKVRFILPVIFSILFFVLSVAVVPARDLPDYPSQAKIGFSYRVIKKSDSLFKLFKSRWETVARFNRIDEKHLIAGMKIKIPDNLEAAKNYSPMPDFLEKAKVREKYILADLEEQFLGAYEDGRLTFSAPISSADQNCLDENGLKKICYTPEGLFKAMAFHRDHSSSIYKDAVSDENISMPYAVLFYLEPTEKGQTAYWLHGGDLPGYPASHGCIRLTPKDARKLFVWLGGNAGKSEMRWIKNGTPVEIIKSPLIAAKQGDVRLVEIEGVGQESGLTAFLERGDFKTEMILFNREGKLFVLLALDLWEKTGFYNLSVYKKENVAPFSQKKIFVDKGVFPKHISRGWNKRKFSEIELQRIAKEKEQLLKGYISIVKEPLWLNGFEFPVEVTEQTGKITHPFGEIRINPVNKIQRFHRGVDIKAPEAFSIRSVADGYVAHIGNDYLLEGNVTMIDHGAGVFSVYLHQSEILVKEGEKVAKGQEIGKSGHTGNADGPHLHLTMRVNGAIIDPIKLLVIFK